MKNSSDIIMIISHISLIYDNSSSIIVSSLGEQNIMKNTILALLALPFLYAAEWIGISSEKPIDPVIQIISETENETVLQIQIQGFYTNTVTTSLGNQIIPSFVNGNPLLIKDAPDLSKLTASLIIPDDAGMSIEILDTDYIDLGGYDIAPSKGNFTRDILPSTIPFNFGETYSKDEFFPAEIADLGHPYIIRDFRGQSVNINPIQYNPVSKTLRVYQEMTIRVYKENNAGINSLQRMNNTINLNREYSNIYSQHFLNYSSTMNSRYDILSEEGSMLIICYTDFMDAMTPFVEWKNLRGLSTEIIDVSSIGTSSNEIKLFIEDYYNTHGLAYVLLVGDIEQIPSNTVGDAASDPTYGFISGTDSYAEVMVGRFSAQNNDQVITQVERMINYERYPDPTGEWYHKGVGVASSEGQGSGDEGQGDWQHSDSIRVKLMNYTYSIVDQVYDPGASNDDVTSAVNDGRSIINYTGHGWNGGWSSSGFDINNVNALQNDNQLPFIWSVACVNGYFNDETCFAEAWLRATNNGVPSGAIGTLMSTVNQSWAPPMDAQDEFNDILVELYENNIKRTFGGISANGCMHMNDNYGSSGENESNYWTLFGDPSLLVRTDTPEELTVSHDDVIVIGNSEFTIQLNQQINGTAALSIDGTILGVISFENDANSATIILDDPLTEPAELALVITAYNAIPYEASVQVIVPDGPYLIMNSCDLVFESNGNNEIDHGEWIEMTISSNNVGVDTALNVTATISTIDPFVQVFTSTVEFEMIIPSGFSTSEDVFTYEIDGLIPDGHEIEFIIDFEAGDLSWSDAFTIPVNVACVSGDPNSDTHIDVYDILRTSDIIISSDYEPSEDEFCSADMDGNGVLNILDLIQIVFLTIK